MEAAVEQQLLSVLPHDCFVLRTMVPKKTPSFIFVLFPHPRLNSHSPSLSKVCLCHCTHLVSRCVIRHLLQQNRPPQVVQV